MKKVFVRALTLFGLTLLLVPAKHIRPSVSAAAPYNIVFILTDDQRWDTICNGAIGLAGVCDQPASTHPMPTVESELLAKGSLFTNAVVSDPLCCPSRAGILSGGFASHHTNVMDTALPNGGFEQFKDSTTLGTLLQQNGYKTALIGKYLNGYGASGDTLLPTNDYAPQDQNDQSLNAAVVSQTTTYVPPGWDRWVGLTNAANWNHNFAHVIGSSTYNQSGTGTVVTTTDGTYLTDFQRDQALAFINDTCPVQSCSAPFFLYLAPYAPHAPATPAPRHVGLFSNFLYRGRGYGETDLSDKPAYMQGQAALFDPAFTDNYARNHLASLRAVDEAVAAILDSLTQKNQLDNTVFIFASDNGYMWGEHSLIAKDKAYEESIRVPLIVRVPNAQPAVVDRLVAVDLDVAPTILQLAGVTPLASDGLSLVPLLSNPLAAWRNDLLIQGSYPLGADLPTWAGIRTADNWKYVEYVTGERELYNLAPDQDPYELSSKSSDPAYQTIMADLAARLNQLQRGVAIKMDNLPSILSNALPSAVSGQPYVFRFGAWGGNMAYAWTLYYGAAKGNECSVGALPAGLVLGADGTLSGTPLATGGSSFCVQVVDSSVSTQPGNGRPESNVRLFNLSVVAPTPTPIPTRTVTPTRTPTNPATVTRTPTITRTPTVTRTPANTSTPTVSATPLPTNTPSATPTATTSATLTGTPGTTATANATPLPTDTPTAASLATTTVTYTPTDIATLTNTPANSFTPTYSPTPTASATPLPSNTPTTMPTVSPTASATLVTTPTSTLTPINTIPPTRTSTPTRTLTPTRTPTRTSTPTRTVTPTRTASATPLPTNTPTSTPTTSATASATLVTAPTGTFTPINTITPTRTSTPTRTFTPARTPTRTPSPTRTATSTRTASVTPPPTMTGTPTATSSATMTLTPTASATQPPTATDTSTPTPTASATQPPTATDTPTPTLTDTPTSTATETPAPTATVTPTASATPSLTATDTPTPTATDTPTSTESDTSVPVDTLTPTATDTPSPTDTLTPTTTETPAPNDTLTPTAAVCATGLPTATDIPAATDTPTPPACATPIPTATETQTPPATDTPAPTDTTTPGAPTIFGPVNTLVAWFWRVFQR